MNAKPTEPANLVMESVCVTEAAALSSIRLMGLGNEQAADAAAMNAMHDALMGLNIDGTIHIGEGAKGEAEKLFEGERVGTGSGAKVDIALLPLEGPTIVARGLPNGLSLVAMTEQGQFFDAPAIYMDKIAIGHGLPDDVVDLNETPEHNLTELAKAKGVEVGDLVVCVLDRPRHGDLIRQVREAGGRIVLIAEGDVSGVLATMWLQSGIDLYLGIGGAPQGVLSAAAMACVGGFMQGRLVIRNDSDRALAAARDVSDFDRVYNVADMASGNISFSATGITQGPMLKGVHVARGVAVTHSMALSSATGTLRYIESHHDFAHPGASG